MKKRLHFANACMFLHAKAMEIYSAFYEKMKDLDFTQELQGYDKQQLTAILTDKGLASKGAPRQARAQSAGPGR